MKNTISAAVLTLLLVASAAAQDCIGCIPLDDLGGDLYLGLYQGGLYPGGSNLPPTPHRRAARNAAAAVTPRNAAGEPVANGRIGSLSISMSSVNQEFSAYERDADLDPLRNARVLVMNGAQGGQGLDRIADPEAVYWENLDLRLEAAGLSPGQVQVVWLKMAILHPPTFTFPGHALAAMESAVSVVQILKSTFPNLAICLFASRIYGGYALEPRYGEPMAYETGFAVKWLIEAQIDRDPELNFDPDRGPVVAPLLLWGPYLWANGTIPRSDGLVWLEEDLEEDGAHPSPRGEAKVAGMLQQFYSRSIFTRSWYRRQPQTQLMALDAVEDASVSAVQPDENFGFDRVLRVSAGVSLSFVKFDLSAVGGLVERAKLSFKTPPGISADAVTAVVKVSDTTWEEGTITFANAPPVDGRVLGRLPDLSRGTATSVDVTGPVRAAPGGLISFALANLADGAARGSYLSREGGEAPRLVLTLRP